MISGLENAMPILAIDTGTRCGYAVEEGPSGIWNLSPSRFDSLGMKFVKFKNLLTDTIVRYKINNLVYEEVHAHIGIAASHSYGGLVAVLQLVCLENKIEYKGVAVQTIKKHATGKGNAKKDDMIVAATLKFPKINIIDDNHADALHLLDYAQKVLFKES